MCQSMMMNAPQPLTLEQQSLTLARLVSQRQWTVLETILTSSKLPVIIDDPALPHAVTKDIVVHFAARFQAPLRILSLLAQLYPESLTSADVTGRYPLHVAAKWAATPDVVAYLIKTNPAAAGVQDSTGKTPMHFVGEFYLSHFNNPLYSRDDSMLQVVRLIKNAAPPGSVNLEDNDGMNAIEYALVSDACLKVVKTMQRACRDDWRARSASNPAAEEALSGGDGASPAKATPMLSGRRQGRRRHNDLVQDMETMARKLKDSFSAGQMGGSFRADGSFKASNDRIHVHRSSTTQAKTHAARTA
ncbi:hypothetical protein ACHAXT_012259 [Thalassiosira profunda]